MLRSSFFVHITAVLICFLASVIKVSSSVIKPITLTKRSTANKSPCNWNGGDESDPGPRIGHQYYNDECPVSSIWAADGSCSNPQQSNDSPNTCGSYCIVKQVFSEGPVQSLYSDGLCGDPEFNTSCNLESGQQPYLNSPGYGDSGIDSTYITAALGSSDFWGEHQTEGTVYINETRITALKPGHCGRWLFLPYYREICGSLTTGDWIDGECANLRTAPNICAQYLSQFAIPNASNYANHGVILWQFLDCNGPRPHDGIDTTLASASTLERRVIGDLAYAAGVEGGDDEEEGVSSDVEEEILRDRDLDEWPEITPQGPKQY